MTRLLDSLAGRPLDLLHDVRDFGRNGMAEIAVLAALLAAAQVRPAGEHVHNFAVPAKDLIPSDISN
jgi:hypothetical protein